MVKQYADSECVVNVGSDDRIRIAATPANIVGDMASVRPADPDPVSEFIRELIAQWERADKKLKYLAKAAGLAPSMPSQIKARTSAATFYTATRLARPFGYRDLPALVDAAWK